jgi:hypothetical protein
MTSVADIPAVRKTITVNASVEHAFSVFTEGYDSWWPRTHHIGKVPMQKGIIETREGGRCYSLQTDGSECDWGRVLVWDPRRGSRVGWRREAARAECSRTFATGCQAGELVEVLTPGPRVCPNSSCDTASRNPLTVIGFSTSASVFPSTGRAWKSWSLWPVQKSTFVSESRR